MPVNKVPVLVAAGGAPWEAQAVARLAGGGPEVVLLKRCVDLPDLLATASTGLARVALLSTDLPGLDIDSLEVLRRDGLTVLLVDDGGRAPETVEWLRRAGGVQLLAPDQIEGAVDVVVRSAATTDPVATEPPVDDTGPGSACGGRLLALWGPGGAPGRTTLAVALAAETASRGRSVLLVDADPYGGTVAQHLGVLDEVSGLLAAARLANAGGLDEQRLRSCARAVGDGLSVLSGLPRADRWPEVRPAAFADLLGHARSLADVVVVDCGFSLERGPADGGLDGPGPSRNLMTLAAVSEADEVLVVGSADPVGLARLARGLVDLHEVVPDVRPRVVVNRCRPTLGFGEEEVRGMVAGFVNPSGVHFVPDDQAAADRALMAGRSLVETGESGLRKAVARLADDTTGVRPQPRRRFRRSRPAQAPNSR